jgi:hypothetical protein
LQLTIAVFLLSIMALLFANITTMYLARNYNTQICMNAAIAGAQAASSGADENQIARVVEQTVLQSGHSSFFVRDPQLHGVAFHKIDGNYCLLVNTVVPTLVPAPVLLAYNDHLENGCIFFSKTCVIALGQKSKESKQ